MADTVSDFLLQRLLDWGTQRIYGYPGGLKLPLYNIIYGPPIFAPLLFAASGFLGLLASLLRRAN